MRIDQLSKRVSHRLNRVELHLWKSVVKSYDLDLLGEIGALQHKRTETLRQFTVEEANNPGILASIQVSLENVDKNLYAQSKQYRNHTTRIQG